MAKSLQTSPASLSDDPLRDVLEELQQALVDSIFNAAGLAIGTTSKKEVKIVNAIYGQIDGVSVTKAAATEVALAGTVTNAKFNVFVLTMDSSGTITVTMGTEGAAFGNIVFPATPADEAVIGFVIINPSGTGNFVGATTDLDDATVVPNAVYVDIYGNFNPNLVAL